MTKAHANVLEELGGEDAYDALKQLFSESSEADRALLQRGVHVGVAIDEHLSDFRPGDFLVHNLMGVYQESKLMINSLIRTGQTIQFQVRDASTADIEMQMMLEKKRDELDSPAKGALLFSCNGRGRRMFPQPHHDIGLVNSTFPSCPVAGFFAAGELGPVGGRTFVHGLTSSLILFREAAG